MTPQEEKAYFARLEQEFPAASHTEAPSILRQEDFELLLNAMGSCLQPTPQRDIVISTLINSHKSLFQLFIELRSIVNPHPEKGNTSL